MPANNGTGFVATVVLPASGGPAPTVLLPIQPGVIDTLAWIVNFSLLSTGSAFTASVDPTESEGSDDLDIILNSLFPAMTYQIDEAEFPFFGLLPSQYRTEVIKLLRRDFSSTLKAGSSIPASTGTAARFSVTIPIPFTLFDRLQDPQLFSQGSDRIKRGIFTPTYVAPAVTGSLLHGGTAVVSAVTSRIDSFGHAGAPSQVGHSWRIERLLGLPNPASLPPAIRLDLSDETPAGASSVPSEGFTIQGEDDLRMIGPIGLAQRADAALNPAGGVSAAGRSTQMLFLSRDAKASSMPSPMPTRVYGVGVTAFNLRQIILVPADASVVADIAMQAVGGAGTPVAVARPAQASSTPMQTVAPGSTLDAFLPRVFVPAPAAPTGAIHYPNITQANNSFGGRLNRALNRFVRR